MQPLPNMELLGFLNWIDIHRQAFLPVNQTIEEIILDNNKEKAKMLASQYLQEIPEKQYPNSDDGHLEIVLDRLLGNIKWKCMTKYRREKDGLNYGWDSTHPECFIDSEFIGIANECIRNKDSLSTIKQAVVTPDNLINSIRNLLEYEQNSEVEKYLAELDGSSAKAVKDFLLFFSCDIAIKTYNNNVPVSVITRFIRQYVEKSYFDKGLSESQMISLQKTLERAFFDNFNSMYFQRITSMPRTAIRYLERQARYKCVFLADGQEFYDLVEKNWETLNEYSGDYLDIFYTPEELLVKGYQTADKLNIRTLVNEYPCIFLWHTSILQGKAVSVDGLLDEDLLLFVKLLTDDIARELSFEEIIRNGKFNIHRLKETVSIFAIAEKTFLDCLYLACTQLQANPSLFSNATENQRNTQIRDLLGNLLLVPIPVDSQSVNFTVLDQTLHGLSHTGKSAGEIDLLVKLDMRPFSIIEALNIVSEKNGTQWNRSYLKEHIWRLGNYDQNGLRRNIILIYADTDSFSGFYRSLLDSLNVGRPEYRIVGNRIYDVKDVSSQFGNSVSLRVAKTVYKNNGLDCILYFFVVGIKNKEDYSNI